MTLYKRYWNALMEFEKIESTLHLDCRVKERTKLNEFISVFKIYNSHTNLVSKNDENVLFEKHIFDSLAINLFLEKYNLKNEKLSLLDIGSGGGFPAIPIAVFFKNFEIYPIDSIAKKIGFIELAKKELMLENLHPLCLRVENLEKDKREFFDIAVSRAVAPLNIILEYAIPYVKQGGYFIAYKSKNSPDEIKNAKNALSILNCEITDTINYNLPLKEDHTRELIIIKKTDRTPDKYPRKTQTIKKSPL